jgi:cell division septal protein FtsQ
MAKRRNRYRRDRSSRRGVLRAGIKTLFGLIAITSLVVLLSAALAHGYYALLDAPWLRVREIEIAGMKHLGREQVLNTLRVPRNANVLNLKMSELAERVETLPWVKSSVVRLDLPGRLVVELTEHEPLAIISADDFLLLDKDGKLFLRACREDHPKLLLVTGFAGMSLTEGCFLPPRAMKPLRQLLAALQRAQSWLPLELVTECRWSNDNGFVLMVTQKAFPVELGQDDPDQTLGRLERIFAMLKERQWLEMVTRIDMDFPNRAYIEGRFGS